MVAGVRRARDHAWVPIVPAIISWALLFGYQWALFGLALFAGTLAADYIR